MLRAVTGALRRGQRVAARRTDEAQLAQATSDTAALDYARHLDATYTLAEPIMAVAYDPQWWGIATPEQIGALWQTTVSWAATGEPCAAATLAKVRQQTRFFHGVDVADLRLQARDVVALLARVRMERGLEPEAVAPGTFSYLVRDTANGTIVGQRLSVIPPAGLPIEEFAADAFAAYRDRLRQAGGERSAETDHRFLIEIHAGAGVTSEPIFRLPGDLADATRGRAAARRERVLTGAQEAQPAELRAALLVEHRRVADTVATAEAAGADDAAIAAAEQRDYVALRLQAADADLRGEDGVHVFQQAALRRFDADWWADATPDEASTLWGYVADWTDGWAKLSTTAHLQERIYETFGVIVADDDTAAAVAEFLTEAGVQTQPSTVPVQRSAAQPANTEPSAGAARPAPTPRDATAAWEPAEPPATQTPPSAEPPPRPEPDPDPRNGEPTTVPSPVTSVDATADPGGEPVAETLTGPEPDRFPGPSTLTTEQITGLLRQIGADTVADTLPAVATVVATPPREATWHHDVDQAAAAFEPFLNATEAALSRLMPHDERTRAARWWLLQLEDDMVGRAYTAGYPWLERDDIADRARYAAMTDDELIGERDVVNDDHNRYDLLVQMLERRGFDEFATPGGGTPIGLTDARPFDPAMMGVVVRVNGGGGRVITGTVDYLDGEWCVDGHDEQGRPGQVRLSAGRYGAPHVQVLPVPDPPVFPDPPDGGGRSLPSSAPAPAAAGGERETSAGDRRFGSAQDFQDYLRSDPPQMRPPVPEGASDQTRQIFGHYWAQTLLRFASQSSLEVSPGGGLFHLKVRGGGRRLHATGTLAHLGEAGTVPAREIDALAGWLETYLVDAAGAPYPWSQPDPRRDLASSWRSADGLSLPEALVRARADYDRDKGLSASPAIDRDRVNARERGVAAPPPATDLDHRQRAALWKNRGYAQARSTRLLQEGDAVVCEATVDGVAAARCLGGDHPPQIGERVTIIGDLAAAPAGGRLRFTPGSARWELADGRTGPLNDTSWFDETPAPRWFADSGDDDQILMYQRSAPAAEPATPATGRDVTADVLRTPEPDPDPEPEPDPESEPDPAAEAGLPPGVVPDPLGVRAGEPEGLFDMPEAAPREPRIGFLWGPAPQEGDNDSDEQLRNDGTPALADLASPGIPGDPAGAAGDVLRGDGGAGSGPDRESDTGAGGPGPGGGELPGQGRPAADGPAPSGGDDAARGGPRRAGAPAGDPGSGQHTDTAGSGNAPDGDRTGASPVRGDPRPASEAESRELSGPRFRPTGQDDLAPSGAVTRIRANLAALRTLHAIQADDRPATAAEQAVLARWSGWGAVPEIFDDRETVDGKPGPGAKYAWARQELRALLSDRDYAAAARNILNAHYTDAAIVQAVWDGVARLGFTGGQVLEPGCGSGNFIGFAPDAAAMVGVEVEPVTAGIAAALYPDARILTESFADTRARDGSFDLVIGNVPFGKITMTDRRHNPGGHSIHDHFVLKGLHLTRPGGLVAVVTSRYTMDAMNPAVRREMAELGDLVGAVRLPSRAHQRAAGTQVVTDLLVFRRREPGTARRGPDWEQTRDIDIDGVAVPVNTYFIDHPDMVLGSYELGGAYRHDDLVVTPRGDLPTELAAALDSIATDAAGDRLLMTAPTDDVDRGAAVLVAASDHRPDGYLQAHGDGTFSQVSDGQVEPYTPPGRQAGELRALLRLRDTTVALLHAEASSLDDTDQISLLREQLNTRYSTYTKAYGPINRFSERRTGRTHPETGADVYARIRPPQGGFRTDPYAPVVYALENFDGADQRATRTEIFTQRVVAPRAPRLGADTADDALAICLDTFGEVRLAEIARLLGCTPAEARERLGTSVFDDPAKPGRLIPAAEYLSGNVRVKHTQAQEAALDDPRFEVNADALAAVIPPDLGPEDITARMGASWISGTYIQQFLRETLQDPTLRVEHPGGSVWGVDGENHGVLATSTWGTDRYPAPDLALAILEQRRIVITDNIGTRREPVYVINLDATAAAQEKAEDLKERFAEWAWEDPDRALALTRTYNDTFNNLVLRSYDDAELSLPGLAVSFAPRRHQVSAVARIISEPAVLLAHEVGAGKTAEMAMGAMELRRLGLARKPAIVVPNHMLEQFQREFLQLYPQAKVLVAAKEDLRADRRRAFVARCATGDWDAVIIAHSSFEKIPVSVPVQEAYLIKELDEFEAMIQNAHEAAGDNRSLTARRLEGAKQRAEERIKKKLDATKDPGITFEKTGIDYVFVDEAHLFKNLRTLSLIPDAGIDGSNRATDLDMKINYLRDRNGERVVTFATATPIANSVTEAHVMQRYLRPDLLEAAGMPDFDSWAATFGEVRVEIEFTPDGNGFRAKGRFAKFTNVPEMLKMWHMSADIKTAEDLNLPVPDLAERDDGQRVPRTVIVDPSDGLLLLTAELGDRAEMVRRKQVKPWEDNMLKISSDGRKAALDLRLLRRGNDDAPADLGDGVEDSEDSDVPTKLAVAADHIIRIWEEHRDRVYPGPDGEPHPVPGAMQLVFCDLGTPSDRWNAYDELRDLLTDRGMPRGQIRYAHEARNDREKGEMFAAARTGRISVLIGSTEKMGIGTNVQARAIALHHLDCPWRPADLQQREGRILRQGNLHRALGIPVQILRYVTERSFDGYTWQGVERKSRFIAQVMKGRLDVREMEDIGEQALSYNEVKALATGNPLLMDLAEAEARLTRLDRKQRAHKRTQDMLARTITTSESRIARTTDYIATIDQAIAQRRDTRGEAFTMNLDGLRYTKRADAGKRLKHLLAEQVTVIAKGTHPRQHAVVGDVGGFTVTITTERVLASTEIRIALDGAPGGEVSLTTAKLAAADAAGLISRLENRLGAFETVKDGALADIDKLHTEIGRARETLGDPFPQAGELAEAAGQVAELKAELEKMANKRPEFDPLNVRQAIGTTLGACEYTSTDQEVTFHLDQGRTGRTAKVTPGPDSSRPYLVRVSDHDGVARHECPAALAELQDVLRYLGGADVSPAVHEAFGDRTRDLPPVHPGSPPTARSAPVSFDTADVQAFAAAGAAAKGIPLTPAERLNSLAPTTRPAGPPHPAGPDRSDHER